MGYANLHTNTKIQNVRLYRVQLFFYDKREYVTRTADSVRLTL